MCVLAACGTAPAFTQTQSASSPSPVKAVPAAGVAGKSQDAMSAERDAHEGRKDSPAPDQLIDVPNAGAGGAGEAGGDSGPLVDAGAGTVEGSGAGGVAAGEGSGAGGVAAGEGSGAGGGTPVVGGGSGSTTPVGGGRTGVPEDIVAPPADSVQTNVRFSQLRGEASFTNCLAVALNNGSNVNMGCNKDGTLQKDVAVLASPSICNMISLQFKTNNTVFLDTKQKLGVGRMKVQKMSANLIEIGYEDSSDADFNDYLVRIEVPLGLKYFIQGTEITNCE